MICSQNKHIPPIGQHYECVIAIDKVQAILTVLLLRQIFTQRRSVAKNVECFRWRGFACQHDIFRTSKHRMMKLEGSCIEHKSSPSSNLGVNPQNVAFRCHDA